MANFPSPDNDVLTGGNGADILGGLGGDDTIYGMGGGDVLYGGDGNDLIEGGAGNDVLPDEAGIDSLYGGDGDDAVLYHVGDANTFDGGAGNDHLVAQQAFYFIVDTWEGDVDDGQLSQITGFETYEVYGTTGNDVIATGDGNDLLNGFEGNDTLSGRGGNDTLVAGLGEFYGGDGDDLVQTRMVAGGLLRGDDGIDMLEITGSNGVLIDFDAQIATSGGIALDFTGFERLATFLGDGNDTVTGSALNDVLSLGGGADNADAGAGDDHITMVMTAGQQSTITGGLGEDWLTFLLTGDQISFVLNDSGMVTGAEDAPILDGIEHFEVVAANAQGVSVTLAAGSDIFRGAAGADLAEGSGGNDTLTGNGGADTLLGGAGRDVLSGGTGRDQLAGGADNDFLNGGWGDGDQLTGGGGADVFYHAGVRGHGTDWVTDYDAASGDVLFYGDDRASIGDFAVRFAVRPLGGDDVAEAFVINRATGMIVWVLDNGALQEDILLRIGGQTYDLLV